MTKPFTVVIGLGITGLSCVRYLLHHQQNFAVTDSRIDPPGKQELAELAPAVPVVYGELSAELINKADELIVSPGVSLKTPIIQQAIMAGKSVIGDIELFARKVTAPVIGITGSNGKSTVTSMVGEMAKQAGLRTVVAGNIGTPILDLVDQPADLFVLELSSFQLETTNSLSLASATILNVSEDHMDRYTNFDEYVAAKQRIYLHAKSAIFNRDDEITKPVTKIAIQTSFGFDQPDNENEFGVVQQNDKHYLAKGKKLLLAESELSLPGYHNVLNALASLALVDAANIPLEKCLTVLKTFKGLAHRCQLVAEQDGVRWFNDSKATNVGSTVAALKSLAVANEKQIILIAGGLGKGADFSPLAPVVADTVKVLLLIGEDKQKLHHACSQSNVEIKELTDLAAAVNYAKSIAKPGDKVILSPACASFDMFKDFNHRGEVFKQLVEKVLNEKV